MDVVIIFSFYYLVSHDAFDGILVFGVVFRGFCEQIRAWAEVKLYSGDVDSRISLTSPGKLQSNIVRSYLEHLEGAICDGC